MIDSLSTVEIRFDRARLARWLAERGLLPDSGRVAALNRRARKLADATEVMQRVTAAALRAFDSGDPGAARRTIAEMGRANAEILRAIRDTRTARLEPVLGSAARERAERDLEGALIEGPPGYDWDRLQAIVAEELSALYEDLLAEFDGVRVDLQAHVVKPPGLAHALFLPGYNEALVGPLKPTSKVRFVVPPGTGETLAAIASIAATIERTASLRDALVRQLRAEIGARRADLDRLLGEVRRARREAADRIGDLEAWAEALAPGRIEKTLSGELRSLPALEVLAGVAAETRADLDLLADLASLDERLAELPPDRALAELLGVFDRLSGPDRYRPLRPEVWRARAALVRDSLERLPGQARDRLSDRARSFVDATARAERALEALAGALTRLPANGRRLVVRALGLTALPPPDGLPAPPGRLLRSVSEELDTRFDLRSAPFEIDDGDQVLVTVRLESRGKPVPGASLRDLFVARQFGLSSRIVAGLALARRRTPASAWEPAPAASWILHWRRWPLDRAAARAGRGRHLFGAGLTALSLDLSDRESIELGLAVTVSFLDDRLLAGYGTDLQLERDRTFWFVSLRLFRFPDPLR